MKLPPLVDIHCHLLPGIDDGATGPDESLAMAAMAADDGIGVIVATPHQLGNHAGNRGESIRARVAELQQAIDDRGLPLSVLPGADVRIESDLVEKILSGEVLSLADRRRHVLLELPHELYLPLDRVLDALHAEGMVGILSHPERNLGILRRPEVLPPLVRAGCLMQITAGSLTGCFGSRVQEFSELLLRQGLVHFVATDAHSTGARCPKLSAAFHRVATIAGKKSAVALCSHNPARVVTGAAVPTARSRPKQKTWGGWFWRKAA